MEMEIITASMINSSLLEITIEHLELPLIAILSTRITQKGK
jgi:hypothetical protein